MQTAESHNAPQTGKIELDAPVSGPQSPASGLLSEDNHRLYARIFDAMKFITKYLGLPEPIVLEASAAALRVIIRYRKEHQG